MEAIERLLTALIDGNKGNTDQLNKLLQEVKELQRASNKQDNSEVLNAINHQKAVILDSIRNQKQETAPKSNSITIFAGADAYITYKWLLSLIGIVLVSYFGFKYIPIYLLESKQLEQRTVRNQQFVDYLRLKQFKQNGNTEEIDAFLNDVSVGDSVFVENYNALINHYNSEIERVQTEQQIKELEEKLK